MIEAIRYIGWVLIISQFILFILNILFGDESNIKNIIFLVVCLVVITLIIKNFPDINNIFSLSDIYDAERYEFKMYDYDEYIKKYKDILTGNIE